MRGLWQWRYARFDEFLWSACPHTLSSRVHHLGEERQMLAMQWQQNAGVFVQKGRLFIYLCSCCLRLTGGTVTPLPVLHFTGPNRTPIFPRVSGKVRWIKWMVGRYIISTAQYGGHPTWRVLRGRSISVGGVAAVVGSLSHGLAHVRSRYGDM